MDLNGTVPQLDTVLCRIILETFENLIIFYQLDIILHGICARYHKFNRLSLLFFRCIHHELGTAEVDQYISLHILPSIRSREKSLRSAYSLHHRSRKKFRQTINKVSITSQKFCAGYYAQYSSIGTILAVFTSTGRIELAKSVNLPASSLT